MEQWADKLDAFLEFNEQKLLTHAGKVKSEALAADEEDLKQLEEIEKKLLDNRGMRHE